MANCKILIVDDDEDDVEILADAFTQTGVESVHYVHSAMEAFIFLQSVEHAKDLPRLIVTDLYLPGITGLEFLKDLKGMEKYKHIHVIVLSSIKSEKEIERYKQMGVIDYLEKPSTFEEYLEVAKKMKQRVEV